MNVLWIMCDQLRYDYLGCTGHPTIKTPHIDQLAQDGMIFSQAYVQSTICGPSRMSAYTGRYVRSHGSTTNGSPLRVGEPTLGDHLRGIDVDAVLIGKTHMTADQEGMKRLGIEPASVIGVRSAECGFDPFLRDDGLHPDPVDMDTEYFAHLRSHGFDAENPWESFANSAEEDDGEAVSGWFMRHADKPARVPAHLSESAYLTDRALEFMNNNSGPWVAHVSYIKPHWPYLAPEPYSSMYGPEDVVPVVRSDAEKDQSHPILAEYRQERYAKAFSRAEVRDKVIPTYMGLISEVDDQVGRIVAQLKSTGQYEETMIVFCSDHGDYLGDHWMGEKMMFHDPSVRIPMIVRDPRKSADGTRGTSSDAVVEMIDIAPTILDFFGASAADHVLEGRSLQPLIEGQDNNEREFAFSEYHYCEDRSGWRLRHPVDTGVARMVTSKRWKLMQFEHAPPLLFDRQEDPDELHDVSESAAHHEVLAELLDALHAWARNPKANICTPYAELEEFQDRQRHFDANAMEGYVIGYWSEEELEAERVKHAAYEAARRKH
jgi:arylsulfatase A-like enzyme